MYEYLVNTLALKKKVEKIFGGHFSAKSLICSTKSVTFCRVVVVANCLFTFVVPIPEGSAHRSQFRSFGPLLLPGSAFPHYDQN